MPQYNAIVAMSLDGVIGVNGGLPWTSPKDLAHFKKTTKGKVVVMGRKTWESLPDSVRPLPGRTNIVITRDPHYKAEGAMVVHTVEEVDDYMVETDRDVWVIGGAEVYELFASRIEFIVTSVFQTVIGEGTYIPSDIDYRFLGGSWTAVEMEEKGFYEPEEDLWVDIVYAWKKKLSVSLL